MSSEIGILHVDDDPSMRDLTETVLEREDQQFTVETVPGADQGLEKLTDNPPDCIVSDYDMPGTDGLEFLQTVREQYPDLPFILFTGKGSEEVASDAIAAGVTDYLQKSRGAEQYDLLANRIHNAVQARREATRAERQERRFQTLVEESNDIISVVDAFGRYQYQSPSLKQILDYEPEETVGDMAWDYIHPDDRDRIFEQFEERVTDPNHEREPMEYRARHADGSWRWIEATDNNQLDNPAVEGYIITSRDTTERKEREQELDQYRTLVESLTDPVYVVDEEGRFTHVNDEFVELVGYDRETILGSTPSLIKTDDSVDRADTHLSRVLSTDGPDTVSFEVTIQPCTGEPIVCEDHMGVLPYDGEEFEGSAGVLRDITERKEYEQRIEAENERLDEFAGIVSHDLRNPLGVVEARLQLAQEECESDHLQRASDALARSQALIEDLLTLAREGRKVTDLEPVELPAVAEGCWTSVATDQATLEVEQLPVITADRSRVKQLFENLYRNAVEHGGTDVTVSVGAMDNGFYVADTGPGIPESEREAVFDAGYSTNQDGTGFGLRIVEEVADAHGWEVAVTESTQGGARFEMTGVETVE